MLDISVLKIDDFDDLPKIETWLVNLTQTLAENNINIRTNIVENEIEIITKVYGIDNVCKLNQNFFNSTEYKNIVHLNRQLDGLLEKDAFIQRGDKKQKVKHFSEVIEWLMIESKRGLNIQRYKGLGEMNPDQLWDTTMNAETRNMLQVTVEDAFAADEIFTTLMGDQVEPRREFIEKNALSVINLDA
jgi:DNA gyrase subunit B